MRGSNDRVEVFKLSENLWFAGTAQLPASERAPSHNGGDGDGAPSAPSGGNNDSENRSERKLQDAEDPDAAASPRAPAPATSAPAAAVDPMVGATQGDS
ncbi:unnamed protein product [Closterium sp. NIES-53]